MNSEFVQIIVLMVIAVVLIWSFKRLGLPPILSYLVAGIVAGPDLMALFEHPEQMHLIAEIGIVFLLFSLKFAVVVTDPGPEHQCEHQQYGTYAYSRCPGRAHNTTSKNFLII